MIRNNLILSMLFGKLQRTIPLKEAASLLWYFYHDPLRSLTLLSLDVLSQNRKMAFSSSKESSYLISDRMVFKYQ